MRDEELIERLQQKEEAAFRWLVNSYRDTVYGIILNILQNRQEAEDVSQEVFMKVHGSIETFKGESSLKTWLYKIAVHKSIDRLRRKNVRERINRLLPGSHEKEEVLFYHPGVQLENKEKAALLFKAISRLPEKQKVAFTLIKVQQFSYDEATAVMQLSIKAIESLVSRARMNLQKQLEQLKGSYE